ncbi:MAG: D-alanine--D-alanine ligase [Nitrospirales bacterium]|nr:MAG: D-alanine--D-alanine ligase [Nitrospirales bacterium]
MNKKRLRVGVIMGGQSAERDISFQTGKAVCAALTRRGYLVKPIEADTSLPWSLRSKKIDVAFLALHGRGGEDGTVQGLLEVLGIPYTGSGVRASAIAMDKASTKALLQAHGIPVPRGVVLQNEFPKRPLPAGLTWPVVVKPSSEGSTIGVSIVRSSKTWRSALRRSYQYDSKAIVENYIEGREIAMGVIDGKALPAVEIEAPGGFYDYQAKYTKSDTRYVCPAKLLKGPLNRMQVLAVQAYEVLGCEGAARVDFRLSRQGRPVILEVNTIPGMTERSLLPMAAAQAGLPYDELVERMLNSAVKHRSKLFA